jgi:hypothetical protein
MRLRTVSLDSRMQVPQMRADHLERNGSFLAWVLFADLLLALAIVFLASSRGAILLADEPSAPPSTSTPVGSTSESESADSRDDERECAPGLSAKSVTFEIVVPDGFTPSSATEADRASVTKQVNEKLSEASASSQPAGFVLSFGRARSPGPGTDAARAVNDILIGERSELAGVDRSLLRDYYTGGDPGVVEVEWFRRLAC